MELYNFSENLDAKPNPKVRSSMEAALKEKPKVLAIIPARGGSKGIPRKNIRDLCGKPLIAYSIEVALKAKLIDRVVVSTEDEEIAEISRSFGAEVPFLRPQGMAQDRSGVEDCLSFTVNKLTDEGYAPNVLVTLYPTHPFRTPGLIDFLAKKNLEGYNHVSTVKKMIHSPLSLFAMNRDGSVVSLLGNPVYGRQAERPFFRTYGLFIGISYTSLETPYLHVVENPISLIDIDWPWEFRLAEEVIRRGLFDFNYRGKSPTKPTEGRVIRETVFSGKELKTGLNIENIREVS